MAKDDSSEDSDDEKLRIKKNDLDGLDEDKPLPKKEGGAGLELVDNEDLYDSGARLNELSDLREMEEMNGSFQNSFDN